jgi:acetylornithine deacetylase/succinyl-diaminopimelate desuccinylase-like protein
MKEQSRQWHQHEPRSLKRVASFCVDEMRRIGMQHVRLIETPAFSVVCGDWLGAAGESTTLFYGHFDVQSVDSDNPWEPPHAVRVRTGENYLGGSAHDQDQTLAYFTVIEAHLKQHGTLSVNVRIVLEGERKLLRQAAEALTRRLSVGG